MGTHYTFEAMDRTKSLQCALERQPCVFVTWKLTPVELHPFLKNKKYFLSIEVDHKNYAGNVTLIPWFVH